jgi:coenzyme F420-reducing hydrogenase alpha subunit
VHRVTARLEQYEDVRADATRFIVAEGHEQPDIERVVEQNADHTVVQKFGSRVSAIVRALNPRARPA